MSSLTMNQDALLTRNSLYCKPPFIRVREISARLAGV